MSVQVVLLCEDLQLATFIRRFLKQRGWQARDIREVIARSGQGSGEQCVRKQYPKELNALRKRHSKTALIVGTDADEMSVADRIATLDTECQDQGIPKRETQDPVVMVVPKRNIETWFAYLRGESTNEDDTYRRYRNESDCRDDVRVLDEMCQSRKLRNPAPPSLLAACDEYKKMPARKNKR